MDEQRAASAAATTRVANGAGVGAVFQQHAHPLTLQRAGVHQMQQRGEVGMRLRVSLAAAQRARPETIQQAQQIHAQAQVLPSEVVKLAEGYAKLLLRCGEHRIGCAFVLSEQGGHRFGINGIAFAKPMATSLAFGFDLVGHEQAIGEGRDERG